MTHTGGAVSSFDIGPACLFNLNIYRFMKIYSLCVAAVVAAALFAGCHGTPSGTEMNVASYNLRYVNDDDSLAGNGWSARYPVLAKLVLFHDFDIFGTQEGYKRQLDDLVSQLPGYDYIGVGRNDGKDGGEHAAIFYRTDRFDVVDHGDFWLSETPSEPSVGWDAVLPRICTWGHFREKTSGREFMFFNLHMDHVGKQARVESAGLVRQKMKELGKGLPVILTGDFNVDQTHSSYRALVSDSMLLDSYCAAELCYATNGTFNSFRTDGYTDSRIDHIFVSPDFEVAKYGVLTDTYRTANDTVAMKADDAPEEIEFRRYTSRTPSDHFPIKAVLKLTAK